MTPEIHQDTIIVIGDLITKAFADKSVMPASFHNEFLVYEDGKHKFDKIVSMTAHNNSVEENVFINGFLIPPSTTFELVKPDFTHCEIELDIKFVVVPFMGMTYIRKTERKLILTYKKIK
jgi:hypothetical protein